MHKGRIEAFSDGVLAIVITIMVLELKVPHGDTVADILPAAPIFLSYVLSFIYIAIYWNNHHHLFQLVKQISGPVLWANTHLLFWLSLIPFVTAWSGENHFASLPIAFYGFVLLMCSIAYFILTRVLIHTHGRESVIAKAVRTDVKGKISTVIYAVAIPLAFYYRFASLALYVTVAVVWFIPDSRIEKALKES